MSYNKLTLKAVSELFCEKFFVPSYQRGYRWTERQVKDLLEDIAEFQQNAEEKPAESFYCLQPVVVKKKGGEWELVDGQQRLTTLYIILRYLNRHKADQSQQCYSLRFETRPDSQCFLQQIDPARAADNIDFYHISQAWETVQAWFKERPGIDNAVLTTLLNDDRAGKNVKFIWYQLDEEAKATTVFSRLNRGKIPLTNAELVKALFLHAGNFTAVSENAPFQQLRLAHEWDAIERRLQQPDFWYFVSNEDREDNRIELLLRVIADTLTSSVSVYDPYYIFLKFSHHLENSKSDPLAAEQIWRRIKRLFMTLDEWFEDRKYYHLVGYLISQKVSLQKLLQLYTGSQSKKRFLVELGKEINTIALPNIAPPENETAGPSHGDIIAAVTALSYGDKSLRALLLLFNIATIVLNDNSSMRFQFMRYKLDAWDIEHISAVSSHMPENISGQKAWVKNIRDHFSPDRENHDENEQYGTLRTKFYNRSRKLLNQEPFDSDAFIKLFNAVEKTFNKHSRTDSENSIGNLTLLDAATNRSYKNAIFPIKRQRIIAADKNTTFVPIATRNVFLKYYSRRVHDMTFWNREDHDSYQQAIAQTLFIFFSEALS